MEPHENPAQRLASAEDVERVRSLFHAIVESEKNRIQDKKAAVLHVMERVLQFRDRYNAAYGERMMECHLYHVLICSSVDATSRITMPDFPGEDSVIRKLEQWLQEFNDDEKKTGM